MGNQENAIPNGRVRAAINWRAAVSWIDTRLFHKESSAHLQFDALDGLRGLAVLLVLISHLSLVRMLAFGEFDFGGIGKYGVYLFFVLSAFLLTLPLLRMEPARFASPKTWLRYASRRVLRIYPLYIVVLLANLQWNATPYFIRFTGTDVREHLTLGAGKAIYWAIPAEFTYYLLLPFVAVAMAFAFRRLPSPVAPVAALVVTFAVYMLWPDTTYRKNGFHMGGYLPAFLMGSFGAFLHHWLSGATWRESRPARRVFEGLAALLLFAPVVMMPDLWSWFTGRAVSVHHFHTRVLLFGLIWALLIVAVLNGTGVLRRAFAFKPLRFVGLISFSIYLWHIPILKYVAYNVRAAPMTQAAVVTVATIVLSTVSYLLIERPCLRLPLYWKRFTEKSRDRPS